MKHHQMLPRFPHYQQNARPHSEPVNLFGKAIIIMIIIIYE